MELLQYWKIIRKSLWLIVLITLVALTATAIYSLDQPTLYESSSTLLLNPSVPNSLIPEYKTQAAAGLADSYTALMRTRSFGDAVTKELTFAMTPQQVSRVINTKLTPNTLFFKISAQMDSPERAQQVVSTTVKVLLATVASQEKTGTAQDPNSGTSEMRQRLNNKLQVLGEQIKIYDARVDELASRPPSADRDSQLLQLSNLLANLEQTETETMLAIAQLSDSSATPNVAFVIDQPLPGAEVPSRLPTNMGLAFAVSLLLGVGVAFLRNYLDYSIHSPEQMEEVLGSAPLAVIGTMRRIHRLRLGRPGNGKWRDQERAGEGRKLDGVGLVTVKQPGSTEAESFRTLRTNIQFASVAKPLRSVVVTSAAPGEGKTFVAANLAVAMAQIGKRVILIDGDLRRPSLHGAFGLPNNSGLTNLVLSGNVAATVQQVPEVPNLMVITSGPLPPDPSELLSSKRVALVMAYLAERADFVIYDSPPAGAVTDPAILGTRVDAVILVARARATRRDLVLGAKQALENVGVGVILPVLNAVAPQEMGTYQGYYRGYHTRQSEPTDVRHAGHDGLPTGEISPDPHVELPITKEEASTREHEEASEASPAGA